MKEIISKPTLNIVIETVSENYPDEIPSIVMTARSQSSMEREYEECFYCGALVKASKSAQGDHFPVPHACGGSVCVPCCKSCHDMKDGFRLENWPVEWLSHVLADFPKMSKETRIFLAKVAAMFATYLKNTGRNENNIFKKEETQLAGYPERRRKERPSKSAKSSVSDRLS